MSLLISLLSISIKNESIHHLLNKTPDKVWKNLFEYVPKNQYGNLKIVSKRFNKILSKKTITKEIYSAQAAVCLSTLKATRDTFTIIPFDAYLKLINSANPLFVFKLEIEVSDLTSGDIDRLYKIAGFVNLQAFTAVSSKDYHVPLKFKTDLLFQILPLKLKIITLEGIKDQFSFEEMRRYERQNPEIAFCNSRERFLNNLEKRL